MNIPSAGADNSFGSRGLKDILKERIREGFIHALFSAVVPGMGQISKGESWRGMVLVVLSAAMMAFSISSYDAIKASAANAHIGDGAALVFVAFLPYIAIWSYAVIDALLSKRVS